jgi:hypothetical protein
MVSSPPPKSPLLQVLHGIVVRHARERSLDRFEFRDVAFEHLQLFAALIENAADHVEDHLLGDALDVFEVGISHLGLHHPELREVAAGLRFFGAEGGSEAVDFAERHGRRFTVELAGLCEVSLVVVEVVDLEKRGGSLARRGRENGRVDQSESVIVKVIADRFDHFMAHPDNCMLPLRPQPKMPVIHEEVDAMVLGRDRIGISLGDLLEDVDAFHIELVPALRTGFRANLAAHNQRRFLGQVLEFLEHRFRQFALQRDALDEPRAIAHDREDDLAGLAQVVKPAGYFNNLICMTAGLNRGDGYSFRHGSIGELRADRIHA